MNARPALAALEALAAQAEPPAIVRALCAQLWSLRDTITGLGPDVYRAPQGRSSGSVDRNWRSGSK